MNTQIKIDLSHKPLDGESYSNITNAFCSPYTSGTENVQDIVIREHIKIAKQIYPVKYCCSSSTIKGGRMVWPALIINEDRTIVESARRLDSIACSMFSVDADYYELCKITQLEQILYSKKSPIDMYKCDLYVGVVRDDVFFYSLKTIEERSSDYDMPIDEFLKTFNLKLLTKDFLFYNKIELNRFNIKCGDNYIKTACKQLTYNRRRYYEISSDDIKYTRISEQEMYDMLKLNNFIVEVNYSV